MTFLQEERVDVARETGKADLLILIGLLYRDEQNAGLETQWDGGVKVWLGDAYNGHSAEMTFSVGTASTDHKDWPTLWAAAARWLASEWVRNCDNLEDRSPVDAGCFECTHGTVPNRLNTGLCAKHYARNLIRPEGERP